DKKAHEGRLAVSPKVEYSLETLFSIIFALEEKDDEFLWFNLSFSESKSQRSFAAYDKIASLNKTWKMENYLIRDINYKDQVIPFWQYLFFFNHESEKLSNNNEQIEKNIVWLLSQMASTFSDRDDFNSYKHSLRCIGNRDYWMTAQANGSDKRFSIGYAKYGMTYLTKKNSKEDDIVIQTTFKAFSPKEDIWYIESAIKLLYNLFFARKAYFFEEQWKEFNYFLEIEKRYDKDYSITKSSWSLTSRNDLFARGHAAYSQKKYEEGILYFNKVLQIAENDYDSNFMLAHCYLASSDNKKAIDHFERCSKNANAKNWRHVLFKLALSYYNNNDLTDANSVLIQYFSKFKEEEGFEVIEAKHLMAEVKLGLNQKYFEITGKNKWKLLEKAEKFLQQIEIKGLFPPETWFRLAFVKKMVKKTEESKRIFEKIHTHHPTNIPTILHLVEILINEERYTKAEELLNKALKTDKTNSNTWNLVAHLRSKEGKQKEMKEAWQNSLKYAKTENEKKLPLNNLGLLFFERENFEEALEYFQKVLAIDEEFYPSKNQLVISLFKIGKYNEILEFTNDRDISEKNAILLKMRAYAFSELGNFEEAFRITNGLIEKFGNNHELIADLYDSQGDFYKTQGNYRRAIASFEKSLEFNDKQYSFSSETRNKLEKSKNMLEREENREK
ncbi:MAG: tetratricopeptide repeat protein, partial [Candidatus Heimdallarchaeota archaeon]